MESKNTMRYVDLKEDEEFGVDPNDVKEGIELEVKCDKTRERNLAEISHTKHSKQRMSTCEQVLGLFWLCFVFVGLGTAIFTENAYNALPAEDQIWDTDFMSANGMIGFVIGVIYTMAIMAVLLVWLPRGFTDQNRYGLITFILTFELNAIWMFATQHSHTFSLVLTCIIMVSVIVIIVDFASQNTLAAIMLIPYLMLASLSAAVTFATL